MRELLVVHLSGVLSLVVLGTNSGPMCLPRVVLPIDIVPRGSPLVVVVLRLALGRGCVGIVGSLSIHPLRWWWARVSLVWWMVIWLLFDDTMRVQLLFDVALFI